jgi:hypothetical protein
MIAEPPGAGRGVGAVTGADCDGTVPDAAGRSNQRGGQNDGATRPQRRDRRRFRRFSQDFAGTRKSRATNGHLVSEFTSGHPYWACLPHRQGLR